MTGEEMTQLPLLHYGKDESIYEPGRGYVPLGLRHYLNYNGLSYNTVWSVGCPFKCTYCGNTKFIDNDKTYRKLRHPTVQYIIDELAQAVRVHPHLSTVVFHDDSFLALAPRVLQKFAQKYKEQIGVPFCIQGVIPNYVRADKLELLLGSGLNRVRMGIQNGSERILKFYERPTPPPRIMEAAEVLSQYSRYMIPPAYDIILDNPVEAKEDVVENIEFLHKLPRPFTLNIFSLRAIPNTELEKQMRQRKIDIVEISAIYQHNTSSRRFVCRVCSIASSSGAPSRSWQSSRSTRA
jgi:coproporphyrinogen III oxidase-like Fe-S oxidoreductase